MVRMESHIVKQILCQVANLQLGMGLQMPEADYHVCLALVIPNSMKGLAQSRPARRTSWMCNNPSGRC
jgi:hypothetical protein